jgi:hypothetical protein
MNDPRQYAPATLRNRDFIVGALRDVLPTKGVILEIASGSGEHVVHFARNFPNLIFQPSDREPDALQSVAAWVKATRVTNVRGPMVLDVSQSPWPIASADGIICINMVHISPWESALGLFRGAAAILPPTAPLYLYGPFKREGFATASSNQAFDRSLSDSQPDLGSARPRSGRSGRAVRRILDSDDHRDARKQSECGVPSNLTRRSPDDPFVTRKGSQVTVQEAACRVHFAADRRKAGKRG